MTPSLSSLIASLLSFSTPIMTTALQTRTSSTPDIALTPIAEHRRYFLNLLKIWCSNHKDDFMSDSFDLKEEEDFISNVLYDQNNDFKVSVKCICSTSIRLKIKDEKIQLSNFQKHLRSTN